VKHSLLINGIVYHFELSGNGEPLLLLHGFSGSRHNWRTHLPVFARHFRVIAVDLLGHGETAVPPNPARAQMEPAAADLAALLRQITTPPVHLLGYSMGGRLALYFALNYTHYVKQLVLESASPGLKTDRERSERQQRDGALADFIEQNDIAAFVARWEQLPLWDSQKDLPDSVRQKLHRQRLKNNPTGLASSLRGMGTGVQPSLWPYLGQLAVPTLLLCGEHDHKFIAINREMVQAMPQARLHIIPRAGHTVHLERPSAFQTACLNFLHEQGPNPTHSP
jgi:2-succinyl-6-hydroxy-2,4-cyclohexadiene-1-carboxylate synthase